MATSPECQLVDAGFPVIGLDKSAEVLVRLWNLLFQHLHSQRTFTQVFSRRRHGPLKRGKERERIIIHWTILPRPNNNTQINYYHFQFCFISREYNLISQSQNNNKQTITATHLVNYYYAIINYAITKIEERASLITPHNLTWSSMTRSCHPHDKVNLTLVQLYCRH